MEVIIEEIENAGVLGQTARKKTAQLKKIFLAGIDFQEPVQFLKDFRGVVGDDDPVPPCFVEFRAPPQTL